MDSEAEITRLFNAFNPLEPATESEYVDTAEVRGSEALAREFIKHLRHTTSHLNFLFSGHIGGGKSTELRHLAKCLRKGDDRAKGKRYLPIYLDILDYVDVYSVTTSDILLATVAEVGDIFRNDPDLKVELKDSYFSKRLREIKNLLLSDAEVKEVELPIGEVKAKVSMLKRDPGRRDEVRRALDREPARFQDEVNSVLDEARIEAKKLGFEDIVVIVDSLDRVERSTDGQDKLTAHRGLFLENALAFTGLRVHKVLALPLSLVRANGMSLAQRYGTQPFVLPVIKVERRDHTRYEAGYVTLRELVQRRASPLELPVVINEDALDHLIRYSGGHPRMFTRFMVEALAETESLPVTMMEARRAVRPTVGTLVPAVEEAWWPILARVELDVRQQIDESNPQVQRMLDELMILEYLNGESEANDVEESAPWYAAHPILRETKSFEQALAREKDTNGASRAD